MIVENFEKSAAFSATGRNVPRTFAPGMNGVVSNDPKNFDENKNFTENNFQLTSSIPNNFLRTFQHFKFKPSIILNVERANPQPIIGPSKSLKLGDLMSKIQNDKYLELQDKARAQRNVSLNQLQNTYDDLRKSSYTMKQQSEVVRDHIRTMNGIIDDNEVNWLFSEVSKRYLLEALVLLETQIIRYFILLFV